MKEIPQVLPPVCVCPLLEFNQYLTNTFLIFKSAQGTEEWKGAIPRSVSLSFVQFTRTDSPGEQNLGGHRGNGRESRAHPTSFWLAQPLWSCWIRTPGGEWSVMGTSGELDHQRANNVLYGFPKKAVISV